MSKTHRKNHLTLLSWNIRSSQQTGILRYLRSQIDVDIFVLSEYKVPPREDLIRRELEEAGLVWQVSSEPPQQAKGVLIASRVPFQKRPFGPHGRGHVHQLLKHRATCVDIKGLDLTLLGLYFPVKDGEEKESLFRSVIRFARNKANEKFIIAGDFNSFQICDSQSGSCYSPDEMSALNNITYDAWLEMNPTLQNTKARYTFKNRGWGSRMDYVFLSPPLRSSLIHAKHDHSARRIGRSDHSAIIIQIKCNTSKT